MTISVEILTIRQLIPAVGNSVIVTSLIIGIFLLFLAYGYRKGGVYQSGYREKLKTNFIFAAILIGIGLSYPFINLFFTLKLHIFWILLIYLLLITAPIVYVLGQTVPITMNMFKSELGVGAISGQVLHLSTLGSFFGSVLTTLIFMHYFGVAWTVMVNFLSLALLILLLVENWKKDFLKLFFLIFSSILIYGLNIFVEQRTLIATTPYANYQIYRNFPLAPQNSGTLLLINESPSSFINDRKEGFVYIEAIKKILFHDLQLKNKKILVIGAGGFTLSAEQTNGNHFTYVDIDSALVPLSEKYFSGKINGKVIIDDGRSYIKNAKERYDVIIGDAYTNKISMPAHLVTREYFADIKKNLVMGGFAIFNIIAYPTLEDDYSKRVDNTIRSVFANCMVFPLSAYTEKMANILYLCKKSPTEQDLQIYTDDKNSSTIDFFH